MFKAVKARFTKPVIPGQKLITNMWSNGSRIHFETRIVETNAIVINGEFYYLFLFLLLFVKLGIANASCKW